MSSMTQRANSRLSLRITQRLFFNFFYFLLIIFKLIYFSTSQATTLIDNNENWTVISLETVTRYSRGFARFSSNSNINMKTFVPFIYL